jgi:hypothetical protein
MAAERQPDGSRGKRCSLLSNLTEQGEPVQLGCQDQFLSGAQ